MMAGRSAKPRANGCQPRPVDADNDRALQKGNGYHDLICLIRSQENAFKIPERSLVHSDALAFFEERPRLSGGPGAYDLLERLNFLVINGYWSLTYAHKMCHARRHQDGQPLLRIDLAEDISIKQRKLYLFYPI